MLRRELAIALRTRVPWLAAALGAALVGHGFVLAVGVFSAASRSALANAIMRRELDPLSGIVRPTLGGAHLAVALLVPIVAARVLAVEKERNTFGALALSAGSPARVLRDKLIAATLASLLLVLAPIPLFVLYVALGGHLDVIEVAVAFAIHVLHAVFIASLSIAAASWARTVAQATTIALTASIASWAIEAGEDVAALSWLAPLEAASLGRQLAPFEHGIFALGPLLWFGAMTAACVMLAVVGVRFDLGHRVRLAAVIGIVLTSATVVSFAGRVRTGYDWTETRRASLPPAAVGALRELKAPLTIEVWLDREDSRRRQLERDVLAKLTLARPDTRIVLPLDVASSRGLARDDDYGRVLIRVGDRAVETRSTSRREVITLIFELVDRPLPDWSQESYPGYPSVIDGWRESLVRAAAYGAVPGAFVVVGIIVSRRRRS